MSTDELNGASLCERRIRRRSGSGVFASASKIAQFEPAASRSAFLMADCSVIIAYWPRNFLTWKSKSIPKSVRLLVVVTVHCGWSPIEPGAKERQSSQAAFTSTQARHRTEIRVQKIPARSEEHTSELQSLRHLVC